MSKSKSGNAYNAIANVVKKAPSETKLDFISIVKDLKNDKLGKVLLNLHC